MSESRIRKKAPNLDNFRPTGSRWLIPGLVLILLCLTAIFAWHLINQPLKEAKIIGASPVFVQPRPINLEGRYLLAGTIVVDRGVEDWSKDANGQIDPSHPFGKLDSYQPELYDAWFADLECPTSKQDLPAQVAYTRLEFNCRPEYLPEARKYFEFLNLSNNHSDNSGQAKLQETRQILDQLGFKAFGDPDPAKKDQTCQVVGLPVRVVYEERAQEERLPVALCAWHYFLRLPRAGEIELAASYAKHFPVFGFLHAGTEYRAQSTAVQQILAKRIIDQGAAFVVGNNPHWVQEAEKYKDKPIIYSTGNFIFDQMRERELQLSVSLDVSISVAWSDQVETWLLLGQTCLETNNCLTQAANLGLSPLQLDYNYQVVGGDIKSRQQTKADRPTQAFILQRLGWEELGF